MTMHVTVAVLQYIDVRLSQSQFHIGNYSASWNNKFYLANLLTWRSENLPKFLHCKFSLSHFSLASPDDFHNKKTLLAAK